MARALALLSGGLDSLLAARIAQEHGATVEAVNFQTTFTAGPALAEEAAKRLGVPLTVIPAADDYFDLVRRPRFGYGRAANPCIDCRIYFFRQAAQLCGERGLDFAVSGEVLGQRPVSQRRVDLEAIAEHSGFGPRLLRPLSAKKLSPTLPEERGWVDRERLYEIVGQSRQRQRRLAKQFGLPAPESAYVGCVLTEPAFAQKVYDLLGHGAAERADYELLSLGRHFRISPAVKIIVGRNETENEQLRATYSASNRADFTLVEPANFTGPMALVIGAPDGAALDFAAALLLRYAKQPLLNDAKVTITIDGRCEIHPATPSESARLARTLSDSSAASNPNSLH